VDGQNEKTKKKKRKGETHTMGKKGEKIETGIP